MRVQGHLQLHDEFEVILDYMRPCLKNPNPGSGDKAQQFRSLVLAEDLCLWWLIAIINSSSRGSDVSF